MSTPADTRVGDAEEMYRMLLAANHHATKRRNLENVWTALEALRRNRPAGGFSIAAVSRTIQELKLGGPADSSIRNKPQGLEYQSLISAYNEQYGMKQQAATDDDSDLPLAIADPRIAARVRQVLAQNRALRFRNNTLHQQFQRLVAAPPTSHVNQQSSMQALPPGPNAKHTEQELAAVRHFLARLDSQMWSIDEASGAILDRFECEVAPPGFVQALRRIVES